MIFLKDLVCSTLGGLYLMSLMHDDVRIIIRELLFTETTVLLTQSSSTRKPFFFSDEKWCNGIQEGVLCSPINTEPRKFCARFFLLDFFSPFFISGLFSRLLTPLITCIKGSFMRRNAQTWPGLIPGFVTILLIAGNVMLCSLTSLLSYLTACPCPH